MGVGAGLSSVSITTAALARVNEEAAGLASGLLSTAVMFGGASGLAVLAAVASARSSDLLRFGTPPCCPPRSNAPSPVWIGGFWPHRRPMRRAARCDGAVPLFTARHGHVPPSTRFATWSATSTSTAAMTGKTAR